MPVFILICAMVRRIAESSRGLSNCVVVARNSGVSVKLPGDAVRLAGSGMRLLMKAPVDGGVWLNETEAARTVIAVGTNNLVQKRVFIERDFLVAKRNAFPAKG